MEILKDFKFLKEVARGSKYDKFLDGKIYKLERGVDFSFNPINMRIYLYRAARKLNKHARTSIINETTIIVQAYNRG